MSMLLSERAKMQAETRHNECLWLPAQSARHLNEGALTSSPEGGFIILLAPLNFD